MPQQQSDDKQVILIDIDALFDTRLGVLAFLDKDNPRKLMANGYRDRFHDEFNRILPSVDMDRFNYIYENRDKSVLALSSLSSLMYFLLRLIQDFEKTILSGNIKCTKATLVINLFPYELTEPEIEVLLVGVKYRIGGVIDIKVISKDPTHFSIETLSYQGFTQYIMYDFNKWFKTQYSDEEAVKNTVGKPEFIIVAPKLIADYSKMRDDEEALADMRNITDGDNVEEMAFELTAVATSPHFNLIYLDTRYFSLIDASNPPVFAD